MKSQSHQKPAPIKSLSLGVLVAVAGFLATPAQASLQVPFKAAFDTVAESSVEFPIASVHVVGQGVATRLGLAVTETTDQQVNLLTGQGTATYHFLAANGDGIEVAFVFTAIPLEAAPGLALAGTWTI